MSGSNLLHDLGICVLGALPGGLLARWLRQPPLLGYIAAGLAIGPTLGLGLIHDQQGIAAIAEAGLVLLMFLIGAEIDLKKLLSAGPAILWGGLLQLPACALLHLLVLWWVPGLGDARDRIYLAVLLSLSSTAIVVKLLYEKFELDTLPGRVTVGILVLQDLWAIVLLVLQPQLDAPDLGPLGSSLLLGAGLVAAVVLLGRYLLPPLFLLVSKSTELTLLLALAWCATAAGGALACGLSKEMGALLAGITISTFPRNLDVIARIVSVRDLFVSLFFVTLGLQIPVPTTNAVLGAVGCAALVIVGRAVVVIPMLRWLARDNRTAVVAAVNLVPASEFALVLVALGHGLGHVRSDTVALVTFTMGLTAVLAPYLLGRSHELQRRLQPLLRRLGLPDPGGGAGPTAAHHGPRILVLGCHWLGRALVDEWLRRVPDRKSDLLVVDFSPEALAFLQDRGVRAVFGDVANVDLLSHLHLRDCEAIAVTLPDTILKGSTNAQLLATLRQLAPGARIALTAERPETAAALLLAGADDVLAPFVGAGVDGVTALLSADPIARQQRHADLLARVRHDG